MTEKSTQKLFKASQSQQDPSGSTGPTGPTGPTDPTGPTSQLGPYLIPHGICILDTRSSACPTNLFIF